MPRVYRDKTDFSSSVYPNHDHRNLPFSNSKLYYSRIIHAEKLTHGDDVKTVYRISLDTKDIEHNFLPGNTIGILPQNDETLIDKLLFRLNLETEGMKPFNISNIAPKAKHLPLETSLKDIFLNYVDIHAPPKKLFLRELRNFVKDPKEVAKLEYICTPAGSKEYLTLISESGTNLLSLLEEFPSCQPPTELILQYLPPLQPRAYSISSSPRVTDYLDITFFVLQKNDGSKGICTSWLEKCILNEDAIIPFYFRQPGKFRFDQNICKPIILIATGTGIAPFRSFLQDLSLNNRELLDVWLFYGCRYSDRDFLYKKEIDNYLSDKILSTVNLVFSRESERKHYVQHDIEKHGEDVLNWIMLKGAMIFVCGDAKTMLKSVKLAIINNLKQHQAMDEDQAVSYLKNMEKEDRLLVDMWS